MSTNAPADTVTATAASLRTLTRLASILNTSLVLFPHVAILALLGAGPLWWAALVGITVLLYGLRRQQEKVDHALMRAFWAADKTSATAPASTEDQPNER